MSNNLLYYFKFGDYPDSGRLLMCSEISSGMPNSPIDYSCGVDIRGFEQILENSVCITNDGGLGNRIMLEIAKAHSLPIMAADYYLKSDSNLLPIVWGTLRGSHAIMRICSVRNKPYIHIDHAYINGGHQNNNYRVSFASTKATGVRNMPEDRLRYHNITIDPWMQNNSYILVCPPSQTALHYSKDSQWEANVIKKLKTITRSEILVKRKGDKKNRLLENAKCIVTKSSNICVEAYVKGIPVITTEPNVYSYAGSANLEDVENPIKGDRMTLLKWLAYNQLSLDEIRKKGLPIILDKVHNRMGFIRVTV